MKKMYSIKVNSDADYIRSIWNDRKLPEKNRSKLEMTWIAQIYGYDSGYWEQSWNTETSSHHLVQVRKLNNNNNDNNNNPKNYRWDVLDAAKMEKSESRNWVQNKAIKTNPVKSKINNTQKQVLGKEKWNS